MLMMLASAVSAPFIALTLLESMVGALCVLLCLRLSFTVTTSLLLSLYNATEPLWRGFNDNNNNNKNDDDDHDDMMMPMLNRLNSDHDTTTTTTSTTVAVWQLPTTVTRPALLMHLLELRIQTRC